MPMMSSRSVKPAAPAPILGSGRIIPRPPLDARACLLPVADVGVFPVPALDPVGAVGEQVVVAVLPGGAVDIGLAPGVLRDLRLVQVGALPGLEVARVAYQGFEPLARAREAPDVEREELQRALELLDLDLGDLVLSLRQLVVDLRSDDPGQKAEDHQNHDELDEREAPLARPP